MNDEIEITKALTLQKGGVAVNVNFLIDATVYVSRHQSGAVCLPHNCVGLEVYDYADFQALASKAISEGASIFTCFGNEDLPIPDEMIFNHENINSQQKGY